MDQFERDTGLLIDKLERWIEGFVRLTPNLLAAAVVLVLFWLLGRWTARMAMRAASRRGRDNLGEVLGALVRWIVMILAFMVAVTIVAPSISPGDLFGFLGIGSVAVGFAFKDVLQNLLAGILILLRQPFEVGDQIISGGHEGVVERIETRATLLQTFDNRRVVIPNADIYTDVVVVQTAFPIARSHYDILIGAGDDWGLARRVMEQTAAGIDGVLDDPAPQAVPWSMEPDGSLIRLYWWTASDRASTVGAWGAVIERVAGALGAAGIDLPYPTRVVLMPDRSETTAGSHDAARADRPDPPRTPGGGDAGAPGAG